MNVVAPKAVIDNLMLSEASERKQKSIAHRGDSPFSSLSKGCVFLSPCLKKEQGFDSLERSERCQPMPTA
jgi:hypothetical protein